MSDFDESKRRMTAEDVDGAVAALVDAVLEDEGREILEFKTPEGTPTRGARRAQRAAIVTLRGLAARDVPVVSIFDEGHGIDEIERETELARAALAKLKVKELAKMASDLGLHKGGGRRELLDRLMRYLGADEEHLAELILRYSEDSTLRRRHATRLVPLREDLTAAEFVGRLEDFEGHYLRTGVAEWLMFQHPDTYDDDVVAEAQLKSYDVEAASLVVEAHGKYGFRTIEREDSLVVRVRSSQPVLRIQARGENETTAAARAFCFAAGVSRADRLLPSEGFDPVIAMHLAPQSLWLLSLVKALADDSSVGLSTVTSVSFVQEQAKSDQGADVPQIESSRFNGRHVLDAPIISGYISAGHSISALSFESHFPVDGTRYPLSSRIAIEKDAVSVSTGFGGAGPDIAGALHEWIERHLGDALQRWPLDAAGVKQLIDDVGNRSVAPVSTVIFAAPGNVGPAEAHPASRTH
jgi:hypothetical protein